MNFYENNYAGKSNPLGLLHIVLAVFQSFLIVQIMNSFQMIYSMLIDWKSSQALEEIQKKENALIKLADLRQMATEYLEGQSNQIPNSGGNTNGDVSVHSLLESFEQKTKNIDRALQEIQGELSSETKSKKFEEIIKVKKTRFLVKSGQRMTVIPLDEIAIFNKDDLVILVSRNGHKYVVDYSLEELMQLLPDNNFYKINRQTILNINAIKEVVQEGKNMIVVLNSETKFDTLKVSQRNIASFKNWLEHP